MNVNPNNTKDFFNFIDPSTVRIRDKLSLEDKKKILDTFYLLKNTPMGMDMEKLKKSMINVNITSKYPQNIPFIGGSNKLMTIEDWITLTVNYINSLGSYDDYKLKEDNLEKEFSTLSVQMSELITTHYFLGDFVSMCVNHCNSKVLRQSELSKLSIEYDSWVNIFLFFHRIWYFCDLVQIKLLCNFVKAYYTHEDFAKVFAEDWYNVSILRNTEAPVERKFNKKEFTSNALILTCFSRVISPEIDNYPKKSGVSYSKSRKYINSVTGSIKKSPLKNPINSTASVNDNLKYISQSGSLSLNKTINYKNIILKTEDLKSNSTFLDKLVDLSKFVSLSQVSEIENFYLDPQKGKEDEQFSEIVKMLSSNHIRRVVLVTPDNPSKTDLDELKIRYQNSNRKARRGFLKYYNSDIELIKNYHGLYNVQASGDDNSHLSTNSLVLDYPGFSWDTIHHLDTLTKRSETYSNSLSEKIGLLDIKGAFIVQRLTISNLVAKLRFGLYGGDRPDPDYRNSQIPTWLKEIGKSFDPTLSGKDLNQQFLFDTSPLNKKQVSNLKPTDESFVPSYPYELTLKKEPTINEINEYLSNSVFIFKDQTWPKVNEIFRENKINLSGGSKNKKSLADPLSFKISLFLADICKNGTKIHELLADSFNNSNPDHFSSALPRDIKVSEPKGFEDRNIFWAKSSYDEQKSNSVEVYKNLRDKALSNRFAFELYWNPHNVGLLKYNKSDKKRMYMEKKGRTHTEEYHTLYRASASLYAESPLKLINIPPTPPFYSKSVHPKYFTSPHSTLVRSRPESVEKCQSSMLFPT